LIFCVTSDFFRTEEKPEVAETLYQTALPGTTSGFLLPEVTSGFVNGRICFYQNATEFLAYILRGPSRNCATPEKVWHTMPVQR